MSSNTKQIEMIYRLALSLCVFSLLFSQVFAQEEEPRSYRTGMQITLSNSNLGFGGSLTYLNGDEPDKIVFSLDFQQIRDSREALTAPFIGDQGKRYVFGKLNNFWNIAPMIGIYRNAIPRGNSNILKLQVGAKIGPAIGILNPYHIELYQAVSGRPFSPEYVIVPYDPGEHSFGEIVGRAGFWSSEFNPTVQVGISTHLNAMIDLSRTDATINGIELGVNADIFFKEVPILAEINGIQNKKAFISVSAGLVFGGRW